MKLTYLQGEFIWWAAWGAFEVPCRIESLRRLNVAAERCALMLKAQLCRSAN